MTKSSIISRNSRKWALYIAIIYAVGVAGLSADVFLSVEGTQGKALEILQAVFFWLVPVNILLAMAVLLLFHPAHNAIFYLVAALIGIAGFFVEYLGVKTGQIFGNYYYEHGLGFLWLSVPPVLAVNWFFMVYITAEIARSISSLRWISIPLAALLMLLYDLALEPFAMKMHLWQWAEEKIPLQNFLAWAALGLLLQAFFQSLIPRFKNPIALILYVLQILFFLSVLILHRI